MRVMPLSLSIRSLSPSMVSGLPASTVHSTVPGKAAWAAVSTRSRSTRDIAVGVPPPT